MTWDELRNSEVVVYSTAWCPDCRRLEQELARHRIPCDRIDIDTDPAAAAALQKDTGRTAIPYVRIDGGRLVRGWHEDRPGRWDENVFLHEADAAAGRH